MEERAICNICAWREFCQKKYSISSRNVFRCPDFTRDLALNEGKDRVDNKKSSK